MLPVIAVMNLIVGTLVGVSGIAGFLLPIVFTGYLGMDLSLSLALSFISFLTSGIIGSYRYQRQGQMDLKFGVLVGIGSIAGAVLGVKLNFMIPLTTAKMFLYLVVLASGLSILVKKDKPEAASSGDSSAALPSGSPVYTCQQAIRTAVWFYHRRHLRSFRCRRADSRHAYTGNAWNAGSDCCGCQPV